MKKTVHKITLIFLLTTFISNLQARAFDFALFNEPLEEEVKKESIQSVLIHREGWKLSYPIIELNGNTKLEVSFDDLTGNIGNYLYKIIHCDHKWVPTPISENEYLGGHLQNQITDYALSFNTYIGYVHYKLSLPNEDVLFKLSGNYALIVYEGFDEDNIVFIKRFIVTEKIADIKALVKRPIVAQFRNNGQEIDFSVHYGSYRVNDPFSEINVTIMQNGRYDNAIKDLKPVFIREGGLDYEYDMENVFPGGSEFRWFDIKSMRYQSPYVKNVEFTKGIFHVQLYPDENRANKQYFFLEDLNGRYYIEVQEQTNNDTDADYVYVYFNFPAEAPFVHGKLYLMGALTNWLYNERSEMEYNFKTKSYEKTLLLKQGYYNYMYALVEDGSTSGDLSYTEGNHYETENDYVILVYHRPVQARYDRVIGYQVVNSVHRK